MTNVATLKTNAPGERRGGRAPGVQNMVTRTLKTCLLLAAEDSVHSNGKGLRGYCEYLANQRPELYVSMLARLIPQQAKLELTNGEVPRLTPDMPIHEMIANFEMKLKSGYRPAPRQIEHDDNSDDDDEQ